MANYTFGKNAESNILNLIDIRSEVLTFFNHGNELIIGVNPIYDCDDPIFTVRKIFMVVNENKPASRIYLDSRLQENFLETLL